MPVIPNLTPDYLADFPSGLRQRAAQVRLLALDVDGTLNDGRLWFHADGREIKTFHVLDGQGIKLLREHGLEVALISARASSAVQQRALELGLQHVYQGSANKLDSLRQLCQSVALTPAQIAYVGDDLPDLPVLLTVGLAVAPRNAHPWVLPHVHWRTRAAGGEGAVREVCDALLLAQNKVDAVLRRYMPTS